MHPLASIVHHPILALFFGAAGGVVLLVYRLTYRFRRSWRSPLQHLPGPPNPSLIFGHMKAIFAAENSVLHENWVQEYGPNITYKGFFGVRKSLFYT